jgi:hypothetical protein
VYHFAVKTFKDGLRHLWAQETDAYQTLMTNKGMVKFLGDYSHENDNQSTHNIMLEYAENDLEEYFRWRSPPVLHMHIREFWENLLRVAEALHGLHDFEVKRNKSSKSTKYTG